MEPSARVQVTTGRGSPDTGVYLYRVMFGYQLLFVIPSAWQKSAAGLPVSTLTSDSLVLVKVGGVTTFSTTSCNIRIEIYYILYLPCPRISSLAIQEIYNKPQALIKPFPVSSCLQVCARAAAVVLLLRVPGPILGFISQPVLVPAVHHPIIANTHF